MPPELADSWSTTELPGLTQTRLWRLGRRRLSLGIFKRSRHRPWPGSSSNT